MKLYYSPASCALAPHIIAKEAGLALELSKVDLATHTDETGADFYAINPKGYVPALALDNGESLTENLAIIQYITNLKPEAKLIPTFGTMEYFKQMEMLAFISTELHKGIGALWGKPSADARVPMVEKINKRLAFVESILAKQPFLMGDAFTASDAYLFVVVNWTGMLNADISAFPALVAFQAAVAARPAVQAAMREEGLIG